MSPQVVQDVCHSPNLPPDGTQSQQAIPSDEASTRMTLRRPRNALEARNPTLAKTNLLDYLLPSDFFATRTSTPLVISLVSYECISMLGFYSGYSFGGDWYRNLGDSGARASSIARPVQPGRACCARARLQATLPLDFKRSIPHLQLTYPLAFKRLIASPSAHTIPHHPDQMTLQSYGGDYLTGDMRVGGLSATCASSALPRPHRHSSDRTDILPTAPPSFRPHRHPSYRPDHTRDDSDSGCDDARYTADAADARYTADAADARDPTDDACCPADACTT
ncbi:hypothetical protein FB107DRAFT_280370 [Schizophyllum commune]